MQTDLLYSMKKRKNTTKKTIKKVSKKKKKTKQAKATDRFVSPHNGSHLTFQQFILEQIYINNKQLTKKNNWEVSRYIKGKKYLQNQYRRDIIIVSNVVKDLRKEKIDIFILYEIVHVNHVKETTDLHWRIDNLKHMNDLEQLPKDNTEITKHKFNPGKDLRDKSGNRNKNMTLLEEIINLDISEEGNERQREN